MKAAALSLTVSLALGIPSAGAAQDLPATERFGGTIVAFEITGAFSNVTLSISGPNAFNASAFARTGAPTIDLRRFGDLQDGQYNYQLTAATDEKLQIRTPLDNGRDGGSTGARLKAAGASGVINVKGGVIVARDPNAREESSRQK
jgi:hypothetical protein